MIKIFVPNNNIEERKYIIDILLKEFLGLDYKIIIGDFKDYKLVIGADSRLIVEDHFFGIFKKDLEYLDKKNIPDKIRFAENSFTAGNSIPIIYGTDKIVINGSTIICGIDIFASSFFMLTRWEEYVNKTRDKHNRFPAHASLAFRNGFLHRPIVNEYVEMLWHMLEFLGCNQDRKKREFRLVLTHDIDHAYKYNSLFAGSREIIASFVKRMDLGSAFKNMLNKLLTHLQIRKDPFDTYDYLMDISEQVGAKSYFFLHSSKASKYDNNNDKFLKTIAKKISNRAHYLGYHPSYNSYNNLEIFVRDKERIENIIECNLCFGRQHYLRFEVPTTWQIWEEAKMEWDSTLSYADREGFRCGVCYPYSVFDIKKRRKLKLKERPLIVMDGSFMTYQPDLRYDDVYNRIKDLMEKVKKYEGEFVILWHNSSFVNTWKCYGNLYESLISDLR